MTKIENITKLFEQQSSSDLSYDAYEDNKDIIWPTVVGIIVALALGWMVCRYKCSSKDRSPHIVRCCPKTLCQNIRLCCMCIFRYFVRFIYLDYINRRKKQFLFRIKLEQQSAPHSRTSTIHKTRYYSKKLFLYSFTLFIKRISANSLQEIPFLGYHYSPNRSSLTQVSQQWPPPFILNQSPSFPLSITVQSPTTISQPKRHPLRRDSAIPGHINERGESFLWPFRTINAGFHKKTNEIKDNDLFFSA
jgi:hypothetical protein